MGRKGDSELFASREILTLSSLPPGVYAGLHTEGGGSTGLPVLCIECAHEKSSSKIPSLGKNPVCNPVSVLSISHTLVTGEFELKVEGD